MSVKHSEQEVRAKDTAAVFDTDMNSRQDMEDAYNELLDTLATEILNGRKSDNFKELVEKMAVIGDYSAQNKFLIKVQNNDVVGPFNGYNQWKNQYGRVPEKGSSALWILAPKLINFCIESDDPCKYCDECDDHCEDTRKKLVGYRGVKTFAYSQTVELDEEEKPDDVSEVQTVSAKDPSSELSSKQLQTWYTTLSQNMDETVTTVSDQSNWDPVDTPSGYYSPNTDEIHIRDFEIGSEKRTDESKLSTLVHECAHALLHDSSSANAELEAESVAYLVCNRLGIETESGVYISTHLQNQISEDSDIEDVKELIEDSIARIDDAATEIFERIQE